MDQLRDDAEFQSQKKARDEALDARVAEWREAARPVVEALQTVGVEVSSVWDLVNTSAPYPEAISVLLEHFVGDYPGRVIEGISRALAVREGWSPILRVFEASSDPTALGAKWGMACALSVLGDDSVLSDVERVLRERRHGENRGPLLDILARSGSASALAVLRELATDQQLGKDAEQLLRKKA